MATFELISDLYKDVYGFRPGALFMEVFNSKSEADKQAEWDSLCRELEIREQEESRQAVIAQRQYEERINGMVADYGISRGTAMRWDLDAFDVDIHKAMQNHGSAVQELEYYLYSNGLGFQLFPQYVAEITAELGLTVHATE